MQLGLGTWIDSPAPAPAAGAGTITPTAAYSYGAPYFGVAFDEAISLTGTPLYTANGFAVVSAGNNPTVNGITCTCVSTATFTGGASIAIPADDPAVTSQGGGLYVTAGTYTLETPPALTYSVDPEVTGTPQTGETLSCNTGSVTGYGYPLASYSYDWERSDNGSTGWVSHYTGSNEYTPDFSDVGKYFRCAVSATVGGSSPATAYSNVVGPVTSSLLNGLLHEWAWDSALTDSVGGVTLAATGGTPTYTTGPHSDDAVVLDASTYLDSVDLTPNAVPATGPFTMVGWVKFDATGSCELWGQTYRCYVAATAGLVYAITWSGSANVFATKAYTQGTSTWFMVAAWYDGTTLSVDVNNSGTPGTLTTASSEFNDGLTFNVGNGYLGFGLVARKVGILRIWDRVLTAEERTAIYAGD